MSDVNASARIRIELDDAGTSTQAREMGRRIERELERATRAIGTTMQRRLDRALRGVELHVKVLPQLRGFRQGLEAVKRQVEPVRLKITADTSGIRSEVRQAVNQGTPPRMRVQVDASAVRGQLSGMGGSLGGVASSVGNTLGVSMGGAMAAAVSTALAGIGALAEIISVAGDFEKSMNAVKAVSGATQTQFESMRDVAKELGSTTAFSASQAAQGMEELAKAGLSAEQAVEAIPGLLSLAAAGELELAKASDIATNVMAGFGLAAKDVGQISDALAKAATSSSTDVTMLGETFKRAGPAGRALGMTLEQTAAAIGIFANAGFKGSTAGTGLAAVFGELNREGSDAQKVFAKYGIAIKKADGSLKDFSTILIEARKAGFTYNDAIAAFGKNHGPKFGAALGQNAKDLKAVDDALKDAKGSADEMADIRLEGYTGSMMTLKSAWEGLLIEIGDTGLLDAAGKVLDKLAGVVSNLTKSVSESDFDWSVITDTFKDIGPGLADFASDMVAAFTEFKPVATGLVSAFTPVLSVFSALLPAMTSLVAQGLLPIVSALDPVIEAFSDVFLPVIKDMAPLFSELVKEVSPLVEALGEGLATAIEEILPPVYDLTTRFVEGLLPAIKSLSETVTPLIPLVVDLVSTALTPLFAVLGPIIDIATSMASTLMEWLSVLSPVIEAVLRFASAVQDWTMMNVIMPLLNTIMGGLQRFGRIVTGTIRTVQNMVETVIGWFRRLYNTLVGNSIIPDLINGITGWFRRLPGMLVSALAKLGSSVLGKFRGMARDVRQSATNLVTGVARIFSGMGERIIRAMGDIGGRIRSRITSGLPGAITRLIPGFADGGIIRHEMLARVGEGGKPEVIIPLTKPQRARQLAEESGLFDVIGGPAPKASAAPAGGGGITNHFTINEVGDAEATAARVVRRMTLAGAI